VVALQKRIFILAVLHDKLPDEFVGILQRLKNVLLIQGWIVPQNPISYFMIRFAISILPKGMKTTNKRFGDFDFFLFCVHLFWVLSWFRFGLSQREPSLRLEEVKGAGEFDPASPT
jgi:hypothetical protein